MEIQVVQQGNLFVNKDFSEFIDASGLDSFDDFMRLEGMVVKSAVRERLTQRLDLEGVTVYVKKHFFPGISGILKSFLRFKFPLGALNEWRALLAFHAHNIPTMTPICAGRKPLLWKIEKESFLLTDDLGDTIRLNDFLKENSAIPCRGKVLETKKRILENLADITRRMHGVGINHRDYYLYHIDKVGKRWMVKDLAALLFSSLEVPVTHGQRLAFYKRYMQINRLSVDDKTLIRLIIKKCNKIARHTQRMYGEQ
jgi:heptose I phosphotransferase